MNRRKFLVASGLTALASLALPDLAANAATTISSAATPFPTVSDKVLCMRVIGGWLWIGGHFDYVRGTDGKHHPAKNLAAIQIAAPHAVRAFTARSPVWGMATSQGQLYYGGEGWMDSLVLASGKRYAFHPASTRRVNKAFDAYGSTVVVGAGNKVTCYTSAGKILWQKIVSNPTTLGDTGLVKVVRWAGSNSWYVGGFFNHYDGHARQGLVRVDGRTGALIPRFDPKLPANSGIGWKGQEDGRNVLSLDTAGGKLAVGVGGVPNDMMVLDPSTGVASMSRWSVGDCQATAFAGSDRIFTGNHSNAGYLSHADTRRMAYLWGVTGHKYAWDAGFSMRWVAHEKSTYTGKAGAYPEFQDTGINAIGYHAQSGLVFMGGSTTGWGNHDKTVYGLTDVHPAQGLTAWRVSR